jgi:hypothetical protein
VDAGQVEWRQAGSILGLRSRIFHQYWDKFFRKKMFVKNEQLTDFESHDDQLFHEEY